MRGQIFQNVFENHQTGDDIEGIVTFLDKNAMMAIATAKQFRECDSCYSFWNTGESFRTLFLTKIAGKDTKRRGSCPEVF